MLKWISDFRRRDERYRRRALFGAWLVVGCLVFLALVWVSKKVCGCSAPVVMEAASGEAAGQTPDAAKCKEAMPKDPSYFRILATDWLKYQKSGCRPSGLPAEGLIPYAESEQTTCYDGTLLVTCWFVLLGMPLSLFLSVLSEEDASGGRPERLRGWLNRGGWVAALAALMICVYAQAWLLEILFLGAFTFVLKVPHRLKKDFGIAWERMRKYERLGWPAAKVASAWLLLVGVLLVVAMAILHFWFNGQYPARLWEKPSGAEDYFLKQAITSQTPLNRPQSPVADLVNPFLWQYFLCVAYIVVSCVALLSWRDFVSNADQRHERTARFAVLFVLAAFLANGTAFGVLYYNLYVARAGTFNSALLAWCRDPGNTAPAQPAPTAMAEARLKRQNTEVWTQDKPETSVKPGYSSEPTPSFEATFQFQKGQNEIDQNEPLGCVGAGLVEEASHPRDPKGRPFPLLKTNGEVLDAFQRWFDAEQGKDHGISYTTNVLAGANKEGFKNKNKNEWPRLNQELAFRRASAALQEIRGRLVMIRDRGGDNTALNSYFKTLYNALDTAANQTAIELQQGGAGSNAESLCPPPAKESAGKSTDDVFRGARVSVVKNTVNEASGMEIRLGLGANATQMDMLDFSFASFTTTGFGDIRPISPEARFYVVGEGILEVMFVSIFFTTAFESKWRVARQAAPQNGVPNADI